MFLEGHSSPWLERLPSQSRKDIGDTCQSWQNGDIINNSSALMTFPERLCPLKHIAVIGMGYWGQNLVRNYYNLGVLRTVCDTNSEKLESVRTQFPDVLGTSDYQDVLNDPLVRGVVIALPAVSHYSFAYRALEKGKDIYVEKPLTLRVQEGQELVTMASKLERILMTGHLLHYHPAFVKLKELVQCGHLGRIQYIYSNRLSMGRVRREENSLWSFAPHDISMVLSLTQRMPTEVYAFGASHLQRGIPDVTNTHLMFEDGVSAHIFVSWLHPFKEQKLIVIADKCMAVFEDTQAWERKLAVYPHSMRWSDGVPLPETKEPEYISLKQQEPLAVECEHFLDCIESRSRPVTDGEEGLRVLTVLDRAQRVLKEAHRDFNLENAKV